MTLVSLRVRLAAVALFVAIATSAFADPTVPASHPAPAKPPGMAPSRPQPFLPGVMGMVVALDPESGLFGMPTPEQLATLGRTATLSRAEEEMISRSSAGLREFRLADGTVGLDLAGRFQEFSVARIGADGRVVFDCASDLDAVRRMLATPVSVQPTPQPAVLEDR